MFKWLKKSDGEEQGTPPRGIRELNPGTDVSALLRQDTVMIFKHSTACPTSWAAHLQVTKFVAEHPEFPLHMVPVIQQRAVSNQIAAETGVRHESPQIIYLRRGEVVDAISHGEITIAQLNQLIAE